MDYDEFYYSIDCKFPYHDEDKWKQIVEQSHVIGGDAPFLVLFEICMLPASEKLEEKKHLEMYEYWKASFDSPIQNIVEPACLALILKKELTDLQAIEIMEKLSIYPKCFNALKVALFSCPDEQELVDSKYEAVLHSWDSEWH